MNIQKNLQLKADQPHPRDNPHTPTDYRRTDILDLDLNGSAVRVFTDRRTDEQTGPKTLPRLLMQEVVIINQ